MEVLRYLFEPVYMLLVHRFTVLGYTISFFDIFYYGILISIGGRAIYGVFKGK